MIDYSLYAITDRAWLKDGQSLADAVEQAILGGASIVQLREKTLDASSRKEEALLVQKVCQKYKVPFIINDDVLLAKEIDADGVHVGQSDMELSSARAILGPSKIIGVTAKTIEAAKEAQEKGANYLGSGAVFGSSTKKDALPMTLDLFQEICQSVDIPVVAIGGIDATNARALAGRGMKGIAIVSGIFAQPDIKEATKRLRDLANELIENN